MDISAPKRGLLTPGEVIGVLLALAGVPAEELLLWEPSE
jgi:hypothetical protein